MLLPLCSDCGRASFQEAQFEMYWKYILKAQLGVHKIHPILPEIISIEKRTCST